MEMGKEGKRLAKRFFGDDPKKLALVRAEYFYGSVARLVYDQREAKGLTRKELAEMTGTTPEIIEKIEDSDLESVPVVVLFLVLDGLGYQLKVEIAPSREK